ncbi:uncharacterized protein HKW66_Vig0146090 [Vigna angularis]|uniref:Uncharacterized protein n=1 Tax=Phaseolus angularis TaxID=3914 RepID=A0A8T0KG88_PHAAN|nr:uncharacterized protein HKW66_Vig0146090 [Vigna angularis]
MIVQNLIIEKEKSWTQWSLLSLQHLIALHILPKLKELFDELAFSQEVSKVMLSRLGVIPDGPEFLGRVGIQKDDLPWKIRGSRWQTSTVTTSRTWSLATTVPRASPSPVGTSAYGTPSPPPPSAAWSSMPSAAAPALATLRDWTCTPRDTTTNDTDKLQELKSLVKELLKEDEIEKEEESMTQRREVASKVRLLAKQDLEIFNAVNYGASSRYAERSDTYSERHHHQSKQQHRHKMKPNNEYLLNLAEVKADTETKKKEDKLQELKSLVKEFLKEDEIEKEEESMTRRREVASIVRLLAKQDLEVCSLMFNV